MLRSKEDHRHLIKFTPRRQKWSHVVENECHTTPPLTSSSQSWNFRKIYCPYFIVDEIIFISSCFSFLNKLSQEGSQNISDLVCVFRFLAKSIWQNWFHETSTHPLVQSPWCCCAARSKWPVITGPPEHVLAISESQASVWILERLNPYASELVHMDNI